MSTKSIHIMLSQCFHPETGERDSTAPKDFKLWYVGPVRQFACDYSPDLVNLMQQQEPVHVVEIADKSYKSFGGWYWLSQARKNNLEKIKVIKHKIDAGDIQKWGTVKLTDLRT